MSAPATTAGDVLVTFGITGDLAKKMTFRSLYRLERRRLLQCPIVCVARDEWSAATLRDHARRAIEDTGEVIDEDVFQRFAERLSVPAKETGTLRRSGSSLRARTAAADNSSERINVAQPIGQYL